MRCHRCMHAGNKWGDISNLQGTLMHQFWQLHPPIMQEVCKKRFFSMLEENHGGCRDQQNIWAWAADEGSKCLKFSNVTKRGHAILSYVKKRSGLREHSLIPRCSVIIFSISQKESQLKGEISTKKKTLHILVDHPSTPRGETSLNKMDFEGFYSESLKTDQIFRVLVFVLRQFSKCEGQILVYLMKSYKVMTQNKTKLILRRSGGNFNLAKNLSHTEIWIMFLSTSVSRIFDETMFYTLKVKSSTPDLFVWERLWPLQEGSVGIRHHLLLIAPDQVSLLFVRDGPALLDLTQLLQTVIEALTKRDRRQFLTQ